MLRNHSNYCFVCQAFIRRARSHCCSFCSNACRQWYYRYQHADDATQEKMTKRLAKKINARDHTKTTPDKHSLRLGRDVTKN